MLQLINLSKRFDLYVLFRNVDLYLGAGQKVGLVGPSGSGKSTLLRVLLGLEDFHEGDVYVRPLTWFGYLPQHVLDWDPNQTVRDVLQKAVQDFCQGKFPILIGGRNGASHSRRGNLLRHPAGRRKNWDMARVSSEVLQGLELSHVSPQDKVSDLDVRDQRNVCLAALLIACPDILVLDEPTQYLSVSACEWLESFMRDCTSTLIVVSNDRRLLDRVVGTIWEIVPTLQTIREYSGNYSKYVESRNNWQGRPPSEPPRAVRCSNFVR